MFDARSLAQVQARAFNARDVDTLVSCCAPDARCLRDGDLLGEGPDAVRDGIEAEYRTVDPVVRLADVAGEPVLAEWRGDEGRGAPAGVVRFVTEGERVTEVRIDHGGDAVAALAASRLAP